MPKELPLLDFAEKQRPKLKKEKVPEPVATEEEYIANLAEEILAEIAKIKGMRDEYKFSKVWGKKYKEIVEQLALQDNYRSTDKRLKRMREIQNKVVRLVFARLPASYRLSSHPKTEKQTAQNPEQMKKIVRSAELHKLREERRAGQTYEESDLE